MDDKEKLELAIKTLENILQSAWHPDIAIRIVMVEAGPIREALKKLKNTN